MTGPLTISLYRFNKSYKLLSDLLVGMMFDPLIDIVLITGGATGLGREITKLFIHANAKVVVFDIVVPEPDSDDYVFGVHYYKCDVSNRKEITQNAEIVKQEVGPVTILINNAGITSGKTVLDLSFDEIENTLAVNLLSNFYTTKLFLPGMLELKRGYIVTIGSILGYMSPARLSVYGASKSGLIAFHESLTYELGPPSFNNTGVKTLLICPGQMKTTMFNGVKTPSSLLAPELDPKVVAKVVFDSVSLGRRGEIKIPFYGNILPIMRAFPWPITQSVRYFSGMDASMKRFVGKTRVIASHQNLAIMKSALLNSASRLSFFTDPDASSIDKLSSEISVTPSNQAKIKA